MKIFIVTAIVIIILVVIFLVSTKRSCVSDEKSVAERLSSELHVAKIPNYVIDDFRKPVPRKIHQIWLGSKDLPRQTSDWAVLASKYGYEYKIWRDDDLDWLQNREQFDIMMSRTSYQGASDIARYEILRKEGGLYVDADFEPQDVPIFDYLPTHGLGMSPEHNPKQIRLKSGAVFFANGFLVSSSNHPIIERVIQSLPGNLEVFIKANYVDAQLATGPYLLNACLFGLYHGIDITWVMTGRDNSNFHLVELNE